MGQIALQVPQVGVANATEDVKVASDFTAIQTLINGNIDPTNLSATSGIMHLAYRTMAVSGSAAAGDWILASPGITVTLPAPSANALVSIVTNTAVTGASPVTVAGSNIFGVGMNSVSSFPIGTAVASVVLQSTGTTWLVISGQQDTGWVAVTPVGSTSNGCAARRVGDRVYLRGSVTAIGGGSGAFVTLPAGGSFVPATTIQTMAPTAGTYGLAPAALTVQIAGGSVNCTLSAGQTLYLDNISFSTG